MKSPVSLIKGDSHGIKTDYRDLLPVNMYPVIKPVLGAQGYMLAYPGLTQFGEGVGLDRGAAYNERQGVHFRLSGEKLLSVSKTGVVASLGTIPGASQAAMSYSFNTQCIVADGGMFLYSALLGLSEVTDSDLGSPLDVVWVDGYYFLTDGEYIYHTDIDDEKSIDPLKFATAEFMPDPSIGLGKTQDNKVIVFGRYTMEYFVDVASANFAFQRVETRAQKIGIVATHAKTEVAGTWFIVGGRKNESVSVHAVTIGNSKKIATREVDKIIEQYTEPELSDIRVESRSEKDYIFILIHLPNETLCYIPESGAWIILKTGITGNKAHRAINGVFDPRSGKWIYGDREDSTIGLLDDGLFTQYTTDPQEFLLYTPFMKLDGQTIDEIEIETIPGFNDDGDASVLMSMTYNGVTWGREIKIKYGDPSGYGQRFISRRLGYVSDWAGIKFRGATRSRMAFGLLQVTHG